MKNQKNHPSQSRGKNEYIPDWKVDLLVENEDVINKKRLKQWKFQDKC
jgi:hypothetical protein